MRSHFYLRKSAGFSVHACNCASSMIFGAWKPSGKITQSYNRGESSATYRSAVWTDSGESVPLSVMYPLFAEPGDCITAGRAR